MNILYFGTTLKKLRESAGMTQERLASKIGVSKSSISFYELHMRNPTAYIVASISEIFHVSTDYLLGMDKVERADLSGLDKDDIELVYNLINNLKKKNQRLKK